MVVLAKLSILSDLQVGSHSHSPKCSVSTSWWKCSCWCSYPGNSLPAYTDTLEHKKVSGTFTSGSKAFCHVNLCKSEAHDSEFGLLFSKYKNTWVIQGIFHVSKLGIWSVSLRLSQCSSPKKGRDIVMNVSLMHSVHSIWISSLKSFKVSSLRINLWYLDFIVKTFRQSQFLTSCKNVKTFEGVLIIFNYMKKYSQHIIKHIHIIINN